MDGECGEGHGGEGLKEEAFGDDGAVVLGEGDGSGGRGGGGLLGGDGGVVMVGWYGEA